MINRMRFNIVHSVYLSDYFKLGLKCRKSSTFDPASNVCNILGYVAFYLFLLHFRYYNNVNANTVDITNNSLDQTPWQICMCIKT